MPDLIVAPSAPVDFFESSVIAHASRITLIVTASHAFNASSTVTATATATSTLTVSDG